MYIENRLFTEKDEFLNLQGRIDLVENLQYSKALPKTPTGRMQAITDITPHRQRYDRRYVGRGCGGRRVRLLRTGLCGRCRLRHSSFGDSPGIGA